MIHITAHRWRGGWELHMDGQAVTQVQHLADARQQMLDYLATVDPGTDYTTEILVVPELGELGDQARKAKIATRNAASDVVAAARQSRDAAAALRKAGIGVADVATLLGVSKGRVSQLVKSSV